MRRAAAYVVGCVLVAASAVAGGAARAGEEAASPADVRCGVGNVSVRAPDSTDVPIACAGGADAIGFLATQGFATSVALTIDVVPALPRVARPTVAGCYVHADRRVLILTFARFQSYKTWFGLPIDAALYRSLVAHEVAHAIGAHNFTVAPSLPSRRKSTSPTSPCS